jgi:hypothetical protein
MGHGVIDLSPLALPEFTRERIARAVLSRAVVAAPRGTLGMVAAWARPGLAAAAAISGLSLAALAWSPAREPPDGQPLTIAEGLRLPGPAASWISEDRAPTEADLLASWDP